MKILGTVKEEPIVWIYRHDRIIGDDGVGYSTKFYHIVGEFIIRNFDLKPMKRVQGY